MSIDLILALALFLGATWVALLNNIITTTREQPAEHSLIAVAFAHFVVLIYFFLATSVLYGKTVEKVIGRKWSRLSRYEEILVVTWPAAVLGAVIGFLATKLVGFMNPLLLSIPFILVVLWLLRWAKRTRHLRFIWIAPVLFLPYVWAMSLVFCGVNVITDQQYYKHGDAAIITAKSEGYLVNPSINLIEVWAGAYPRHSVPDNIRTGYVRVVQPITSDMAAQTFATNRTYIRVVYTPEAWWFPRETYIEVSIIP